MATPQKIDLSGGLLPLQSGPDLSGGLLPLPPEPSTWDTARAAGTRVAENVNKGLSAANDFGGDVVHGLANTVTGQGGPGLEVPLAKLRDFAAGVMASHYKSLDMAQKSSKEGDWLGTAQHELGAMVPVIGPGVDQSVENMVQNKRKTGYVHGEDIGDVVTAAAPAFTGAAIRAETAVPEALSNAAEAVPAAGAKAVRGAAKATNKALEKAPGTVGAAVGGAVGSHIPVPGAGPGLAGIGYTIGEKYLPKLRVPGEDFGLKSEPPASFDPSFPEGRTPPAWKADPPATQTPAGVAPQPPPPAPPPMPPEQIRGAIAAKRAAMQSPAAPAAGRTPLWQQAGTSPNERLTAPPDLTPETPPARAPRPTAPPPSGAIAEAMKTQAQPEAASPAPTQPPPSGAIAAAMKKPTIDDLGKLIEQGLGGKNLAPNVPLKSQLLSQPEHQGQFARANGLELHQAIPETPEGDVLRAKIHDLTNVEVRQLAINAGEDMGQQRVGNRKGTDDVPRQDVLKKILAKNPPEKIGAMIDQGQHLPPRGEVSKPGDLGYKWKQRRK